MREVMKLPKSLYHVLLIASVLFALKSELAQAQEVTADFAWPEGKRAAVSLSFDDARASQVDTGTALLNRYDVKATFLVRGAGRGAA